MHFLTPFMGNMKLQKSLSTQLVDIACLVDTGLDVMSCVWCMGKMSKLTVLVWL